MLRSTNLLLFAVPVAVLSAVIGSGLWQLYSANACTEGPNSQAYEIAKSVQIYEIANHRPATELNQLVPGIMEQLPLDPWGHSYRLIRPGLRNPAAFDVVSPGEDGEFYTDDDLGNWPRVERPWRLAL